MVQVQHGIGILSPALIHQAGNVDVVSGHSRCEAAQGVWNIFMQNGDPALRGTNAHITVGEVDRIDNIAVFQIVHQFGNGHLGTVVLGLLGGGPQVRNGNAAGHIGSLLIGKVRDIALDLPGCQSLCHSIVVHQQIPGKVQNNDSVLHLGNGFGVDHLLGVLYQGRVERNNVAGSKNLIPAVDLVDLAVQMPGGIDGDKGVTAVNLHTQLPGSIGEGAAHSTQADNPQLLAQNLMAGKLRLALFHLLGHIRLLGNGLHPVDAAYNVTATQKQAAESQLHNAAGVGTGGIEDHNSLLGTAVQGDIVHTGTGPGNGHQVIGKGHIVKGSTADHQSVCLLNGLGLTVILRPEGRTLGGDFIQIVYLKHDFLSSFSLYSFFSKDSIKPTSFFTPSMGIAL